MENCCNLGTESQKKLLTNILNNAKKNNWTIIKVLADTQDVYGYLPKPVIEHISKELNMPTTKIYGVATFYAQFSLSPKGKYPISVCLGTACYVKGGQEIFDKICNLLNIKEGECTPDLKFSIDETRCVGCCGKAPVLTVGEDLYTSVKLSEVEGILRKYMEKN